VDEASTIDVLCVDKTGTLTCNELQVTTVQPMPDYDEAHVLAFAAMASSDGGTDPVDAAIRASSRSKPIIDGPQLIKFKPFDPATKMSEATVIDQSGENLRVVKGAFTAIMTFAQPLPIAQASVAKLEGQGFRVLAVAAGSPKAIKLMGLIALSDPPRADSVSLITELQGLGVRTVMVTGDAPATATIVAHAVGLQGAICSEGPISIDVQPETFAVFAGVLPDEKFQIIMAFQKSGHMVGMCGDGANDAPALRQAQIGIAVSTATDVAKSAAGIVLVSPGLAGIVAAVREGRITFQRILTYTLNSIVKKIVTVLFLIFGLIMTEHAILTPLLMVIIMITGDFLAMSLTTDNVTPSPMPNKWNIGALTTTGIILGVCLLVFCAGSLTIGKLELNLKIGELQTLTFVSLVFGSQAAIYSIRERRHLWSSRPSTWLIASSVVDILIASILAVGGFVMVPLPFFVVVVDLLSAFVFAFVVDMVKVQVFAYLKIS
jgi:H+-transporting ATPase